MKKIIRKFKDDYRHYICTFFLFVSIAAGHFFPNGIPRVIESIRDLVTSFVYYFVEIFSRRTNKIDATVLRSSELVFGKEIWKPITLLPATLEEFFAFWHEYWKLVFNIDNLLSFFNLISDVFFYSSRILLIMGPLLILIAFELQDIKNTVCTDRHKKSRQLLNFEAFLYDVVKPCLEWFKGLVYFVFENKIYLKIFLIVWAINLNVISIAVSILAYFFYLVSSWNFLSIYGQLLKLQKDLTPVVRFIPGIVWFCLGYKLLDHISRSIGSDRLYYAQRCNEAVIRDRGIVTIIAGGMRKGKTKLATSMSLVAEKVIFDDMYKVMCKYEGYFPNFPWQIFRDELSRLIDNRIIVDLDSARSNVQKMGKWFEYIYKRYSFCEYQYFSRKYRVKIDRSFSYNYDLYPVTYNDSLKITPLFKALEEYACAFYTFTVKTNLIFANYSIRDDSILRSYGNKPFRDNDFLRRSPELRAKQSTYSHILDMDMLRLQTKVEKDNDNARVLHPGAYIISEIDKERKNMLELKEMKVNTDDANQKNDGFNATLMMAGHANLVDYIPIIKFFGDLQRPENLGAGARELGDVINIVDKTDIIPVLPFFSPYWLTSSVFYLFKRSWDKYKDEYDKHRSDQILFVYLVQNIVSILDNYFKKIENFYGIQTLKLEIQSGSLEGESKIDKWRSISIFDLAERYSSDCLKGVFVSDPPNEKHIDDYIMYEGILATPEELSMQKSYFYDGIHKMKGDSKNMKK